MPTTLAAPAASRVRHVAERHQVQWAHTVTRATTVSTRLALDRAFDGRSIDPARLAQVVAAIVGAQTRAAGVEGARSIADCLQAAGIRAPDDLVRFAPTAPETDIPAQVRNAWRRARAAAPRDLDLHAGLLRAEIARIIGDAHTASYRQGAEALINQSPAIVGWRRIARPGCCGCCLALSGPQVWPADVRLAVHARCRCTQEPVIAGVNEHAPGLLTPLERWDRMTAAEQNDMFYGHGGEPKADLIRTGKVHLADLVATEPRHEDQRPFTREATYTELLNAGKMRDDDEAARRQAGEKSDSGRVVLGTGDGGGKKPPANPSAPPAPDDQPDRSLRDWLLSRRRDRPSHVAAALLSFTDFRTALALNTARRRGHELDSEQRLVDQGLHDGLEVIGRPGLVYRAVFDLRHVFNTDDPRPGQFGIDLGWMSTSVSVSAVDRVHREFWEWPLGPPERPAVLAIDVPAAQRATWVGNDGDPRFRWQEELLLEPGTGLTVVDVRRIASNLGTSAPTLIVHCIARHHAPDA